MKKLMLIATLALPLSIFAQKAPEAVQKAFKKRFPTATKVGYVKEKNGEYEAGFKLNGVSMSANFTADGVWRETESVIPTSALPANVTKTIATKYPNAKLVGAAKIETSDKGIRYEADLKTGLKKSEVFFDADGNVVK